MKNFTNFLTVIILLIGFSFTSVKAQMSGTYTVGSGGTYTSLTSAYNALVSNGINGSVTLSVISNLSGSQTLSGTVTGASATNTITITSSTGNASSYTIGTGSSSYALYLSNGVKYLTVKDLTIGETNNTSQYYGVYFTTSSTVYTNIEFRGCNINTLANTTSSSYAAVYYSGTSSSSYYFNNLRFKKNNIFGGYYNIYLYYPAGATANMASRVGVTIDSNVLSNGYYYGIYSYSYGYYPSISYNTITSQIGSSTYMGIYTYNYTTIDSMIGNKITITSSSQGFGMYLYYYQNYSTSYGANGPMFIANNEIRILSSASTSYGMYAYGSSNYSRFDILNNSIYVNGTSTCYGLYWYPYSTSYKSKFINNNVHVNTSGTAYMVNYGSTSYASTSYVTMNYNNYYRTGTGTTTYYGSSSYTSLSSWQSAYSQDMNTSSNTMNYVDLNTNMELSSYTGFTCPRYSGVSYDIRNNLRGTTTYKGCYEPFTLDAGIAKLASTPASATNNQWLSLSATLRNAGITTLTGATINWKFKDTVRTAVPWTGALTSGSTTNVSVGSAFITSGNTNPVKMWVSNPNASTDQNAKNDTINFSIYGCDSALRGTYTIGGAGADFATINDALMPMMNCGISGPVTFNINTGTYNESMILTGAIPGSSTTNTVTFTSTANNADSVQIYVSGTTCSLTEVANVRFKNITLGTQSSTGEKAVLLNGSCTNIEFYQCNLYAYSSATSTNYIPVYYYNAIAGKCLTNVKFIKNNIVGGFVNMSLFTSSNVGTGFMGSVTIDSNTMTEGYRGGFARTVESTNSYYMYFPSISYNTIIGKAAGSSYQYGICLGSAGVNPTTYGYYDVVDKIVGNKIVLQINSVYGCGILLSTYHNYYNSSGSGGSGTQCLVANNEIIHNSTSVYSYGIWAYYSKANIINNSIYLKNTSTSYNLYGIYIYNSSTSYGPMTIKNNNIVVDAANPTYGFPIYYSDGSAYLTTSYKIVDYNNYYSTGSFIGYASGNIMNLSALRALTGQDQNSLSQPVNYKNFPNDLSVYGYNLPCATFSPVLNDINNVNRGLTTTTMGAYQFTPFNNYDIQPYSLSTPSTVITNGKDEIVRINLMNLGKTTLTTATINWYYNNVLQVPVVWTGSLAGGNSTVVMLDTITPTGGKNTLKFITSLPNNQVDMVTFNDTLTVNIFACDTMLNGTYTVGTGGQYSTIDDAIMVLNSCGINGPVTFALLNGVYPPLSIFGGFTGLSATNTLTFTSASGNANDVTIGNSLVASTTALNLSDASHLIFKNITIGLNSTYTGNAVELNGQCEDILFYGCNIQTYQDGTGTAYCGVKNYSSSGATKYLKNVRFIKNNIDGGYYNFWFYYPAGSTTNMASSAMSVTIDSNTLTNSYSMALYSNYYARYNSLSYNTITSRNSGSVTSTWYGMYLYYYQNVDTIVGNKILSSNTSITYPYGMYIYYYFNYTSYYGSGAGIVANNEIILRTTSSYYGIGLYNPNSNVQLLHNSIYMYGTGNAYALYVYNSSSSYRPVFKNNNLVTVAGTSAYPIYYNGSYYNTSYFDVDYNNYYSSGSNVGYAGAARTTLAALQSATLQDANSVKMNPGFAATPTNLIPVNWSMCPILSQVPIDLSGEKRIGITYRGCYTAVFSLDAGIIEFVGLGTKSSAGTNAIKVRLMNFGTTTLSSVTLNCSIDGVNQTPVSLSGLSLAQYKDTVITIGSFVATVGVTTNLKAWTSLPNASTDQNYGNDTVVLATKGCAQVLYGTYDVGGGNNDFASISAALSALSTCGVSGPVVLRLADGSYPSLSSITTVYEGTSATNRVTFTSLSGNVNNVVIGAASGAALTLNGAKNLRFEKVTIGDTVGNTTYGVSFVNTNENIEFYGCNIYSYVSATSTSYACVYYYNNTANYLKNVKFIKNTINGGYYNFYMYYPTNSTSNMSLMSVTIDSNIIKNAYYYALYLYEYGYYPSISYNTMLSRNSGSVASYWYGIYMYYYNSIEKIEGNKIKSTNTAIYYPYGMYISQYVNYNGYGTSNNRPLVKNNEIIVACPSSYSVNGIYLYYPYSNLQLLNNSVYAYGGGSGYGLYSYNGSTTQNQKPSIIGNIIHYVGTNYAAYYGSYFGSSYYEAVDYNNYYNVGGTLAYANSAITTLASLKSTTGQEAHSLNQNPGFLTPTINLHTNGTTMLMDPLSTVLTDLDGKSRVAMTNMGCYHDFVPKNVDAKMYQITSPAGGVSVGVGTPISVKVMNFGSNRLDSVMICWKVNGGTLNSMKYYGSLAFGSISSSITLGNFVPLSGLNTLLVYTTSPNGLVDQNTTNDTLLYSIFACDTMFNGVYSVGTGKDFTTFDIAITALKNCGINGPVELLLDSGTYNGITINYTFPGTSTSNMITFTSATGNASSVVFNTTNGTGLTLDGAKNLKFKNLTFGNTTNGMTGVTFLNINSNIVFYGCNVYASLSNTSNTCAPFYYNNTSGSNKYLDNISIIKNNIDGGYSSIYFYYAGSSSDPYMGTVTIDSNTMTNAYYYGIRFYYYTYCPSISYNNILMRSATTNYVICIEGNYNTVDTMVGNRIRFQTTGTRYATYFGAYLNYNTSYKAKGPAYIANNEIISLNSSSSAFGFYFVSSYYNANVLHNSVYLSGTSTYYAFYLSGTMTNAYSLNVKNNVFVTLTSGTGYPIYVSTASNALRSNGTILDYNNYYSNGLYIGYIGNNISNLSGLQSATGQDSNSIYFNPDFINVNNNLHCGGFNMLINTVPSVLYDINKRYRGSYTNMGCYHDFNPYNNDAKMISYVSPVGGATVGMPTPLSVTITNMGIDTLKSVRLHWKINNGAIDSVDYNCLLPFGVISPTITLDTFIPIGKTNTFLVYTTLPNGNTDQFPVNDTLTTSVFGCDSILNGEYTVGTGGDFATKSEALNALYQCGIKGPVVLKFMAGTYDNLMFNKNIPGSGATNTVTFTSISGNVASVTFLSGTGVGVALSNVSNLIFKNVTIDASLGTNGVEFTNICSNILFYGCKIIANLFTTSSTNCPVRFYNGSSGHTNYLSNGNFIKNEIMGGYYNFYLYYPCGSSTYMSQSSIRIDSNTFTDSYYAGIYVYSYGYFPSISHNIIKSRAYSTTTFYGIYLSNYCTADTIDGNKINANTSTTLYGMYLYYLNNSGYNAAGSCLLINNELILTGTSTLYGLYMYYPRVIVSHNSMYITGTSTTYGIYTYINSNSYFADINRNNFYFNTPGTLYTVYNSPGTSYLNSTYWVLDYNNYYKVNAPTVYYGYTSYTTLASWKAAYSQDANSIQVLPSYINPSVSLDLNDYSSFICPRGTNVLYDIKGEARTALTPMGAYSTYVFEGNDMGLNAIVEPINTSDVHCYEDFADIKVAVANRGSINIDFTTTPMRLRVNVQGAVSFQADTLISVGSLTATKKDTIKITSLLPVTLNGLYTITAWLELPIDQKSNDDTIQSVYRIDKIGIPYNTNFDSMPNGLVFKQLVGTSCWSVQSGNGVNPIVTPSHGNGRLTFSSEAGRGSMARVTLQPFDLQGSVAPQMKFWYAHDAGNSLMRDYTDVKISTDGGITYKTLLHLQRYNAAYATPTFVKYEINLNPYTAYACVIVAFEAGSYGGGNQNIDSIAVISKKDVSLDLNVPSQSEFVACELTNKPISITLTNTTAQVFDFEKNPSQINVAVTGAVTTSYTIPLTTGSIPGDTLATYLITNNFDFTTNGTYNFVAYLASADDYTLDDTARTSRIINVDAVLMSVDSIASKDTGELVYPIIHIKNIGNLPINEIPLSIKINNVQVLTETMDTLLNPGDSITYTFVNPYKVPNATEQQPYYQMKIEITLPCDGVISNNSKSKYYNVNVDGSIDLSFVKIIEPLADTCKFGYTKIYPSLEIYNSGTGYAFEPMLYVLIDSAGVQIQAFAEKLDGIASQVSITHNCTNYYTVPNFTGNYNVVFKVDYKTDINKTNNSQTVTTCSKGLGIPDANVLSWTLDQNIPNPATNSVVIPFSLPKEGEVTFKVTSINGQVLYQQSVNAKSGSQELDFNTSMLASGIYYYSMEYQGQRLVKKMTVQR